MPTAARTLVDQLIALGADVAFGVPGESYLAVLDALYDTPRLRFVTCRHEGGAAFAAEAHGKLTGRPGVLMVTRGPGVLNAAVGIHTAQQDETPLLVFVGLVPRHQRGRDAFQELDLGQAFGSICKWVHELDQPSRVPEADTAAEVAFLLGSAARPLAIAGGSRWSEAAIDLLPQVLPGVPLVTGFRRQDLIDHRLPSFAGSLGLGSDPALVARVAAADLVLAVGYRLDDPTTDGFTLFPPPGAGRRLVHVHPEPRELGRVFLPTISIAAEPEAFLRALPPIAGDRTRSAWTAAARAGYVAWSATESVLDEVARGMREVLPDDAIVTNGAGNFTRPLQRSFAYRRPGRQLAPVGGSMGYGLPAALAAKLAHPDRVVVCVAGDGDLLMTAQELATVMLEGAAVVVLVVDNGVYGTIRTHQQRRYPGRPIGTTLSNPDFVTFAMSFGMQAERTTTAPDTVAALRRAVALDRPALVHLVTE